MARRSWLIQSIRDRLEFKDLHTRIVNVGMHLTLCLQAFPVCCQASVKVGVANYNCNFVGTQVHSLVASDDTGSKAWATEAMIIWQLQLGQALVNGTEGTLSAKELEYLQREYKSQLSCASSLETTCRRFCRSQSIIHEPVSAVCPTHVYATGYSFFNAQFAQVFVPSHCFSNVRGVGFPI